MTADVLRMTAAQYRARFLADMSEDTVQRSIVVFLETLPPPPVGPWWTAVNPLPGKKSKAAAGRAKWLGLVAGAPDLVFCWSAQFAGCEVKRPKGGRLSVDQLTAHALIGQAGGAVGVVRSLSEFIAWMSATYPAEWPAVARFVPRVWPWWETP